MVSHWLRVTQLTQGSEDWKPACQATPGAPVPVPFCSRPPPAWFQLLQPLACGMLRMDTDPLGGEQLLACPGWTLALTFLPQVGHREPQHRGDERSLILVSEAEEGTGAAVHTEPSRRHGGPGSGLPAQQSHFPRAPRSPGAEELRPRGQAGEKEGPNQRRVRVPSLHAVGKTGVVGSGGPCPWSWVTVAGPLSSCPAPPGSGDQAQPCRSVSEAQGATLGPDGAEQLPRGTGRPSHRCKVGPESGSDVPRATGSGASSADGTAPGVPVRPMEWTGMGQGKQVQAQSGSPVGPGHKVPASLAVPAHPPAVLTAEGPGGTQRLPRMPPARLAALALLSGLAEPRTVGE